MNARGGRLCRPAIVRHSCRKSRTVRDFRLWGSAYLAICLHPAAVLAAPMAFTIDTTRSQITLTHISNGGLVISVPGSLGLLGGINLQGPGSNVAPYSGTLLADVNFGAGTISFPGGSQLIALPSGNWFPATVDPPPPQTGPANYAFETVSPAAGGVEVVLNFVELDASSAGPLALVPLGGGDWTLSSALALTFTSGTFQGSQGLENGFGPPRSVVGRNGTNQAASATLRQLGNHQELTLPVDLTLFMFNSGTPTEPMPIGARFQGQLVAVAQIPEPSAWVLAATGWGLCLRLWQRRAIHRSAK